MNRKAVKNVMSLKSKSHDLNDEIIKSGTALHLNCKWFMVNYEKFKEQYRERFVAVYDKKIVDSDINIEKLMNRLSKVRIDGNAVYTMFVPEESAYLVRVTKRR